MSSHTSFNGTYHYLFVVARPREVSTLEALQGSVFFTFDRIGSCRYHLFFVRNAGYRKKTTQ
jgi:hypothetical protein